MLETHGCPVAHCARACPKLHLMCVEHWRMVPKLLQGPVHTAARAMRRRPSTANVREYRDAADAAIAAVTEKLEAKARRVAQQQEGLFQEP